MTFEEGSIATLGWPPFEGKVYNFATTSVF